MVDEGFRVYSTEGILVTEVPLTTKVEYGAGRIVYHRMDLNDALKKATQKTSTIRVAFRVVDL
jgi:salicylate hydroxylase